jgi:hypothetical protein
MLNRVAQGALRGPRLYFCICPANALGSARSAEVGMATDFKLKTTFLTSVPFEEDNIEAYRLLLRIEIALRECLKASLESEFGVHWRKKLPGELLKKIKESQTEENRPQFDFIRLGPLYYLTLGELLPLLQQKYGHSVTERLGGDCFLKQLENILGPRNALCHSRPVSSVGLKTIETLYSEMETALTVEGLARLVAKPDVGLAQDEAAKALFPSLRQAILDLPHLPPTIPTPEAFQSVTAQFWWADDSLAGFNRSFVDTAIILIREYNALPTGVGSAGVRQKFCEERDLHKSIKNAINELEKVKS